MDAEPDYNEYLADEESARLGFSNTEMARQLQPLLKRMEDEDETGSA